ncbi:MAG: hypothetical protein EXS02_01975 [Planctomycetes bacterium]|nr:hypothetical protein [Planctomycetota bacterium]
MEPSALAVVGLTCNVVGVFFLANSIRFRDPRRALAESLAGSIKSLDKVRDIALNTMQVVIGFLFLTTGFLLQIVGRWDYEYTTLAMCFGIVLFAVVVYGAGAYTSRRTFKRLLREFFRAQPNWSFTEDMVLTKEVGAVLGVQDSPDMTVEAYVQQVRLALGMTAPNPKLNSVSDRARRIVLPGR